MPRVLLLIPTESYRARDFLQAADQVGVEAVVGTDQRPAYNPADKGRLLALPFDDPAAATERIEAFHQQWPLDAVVAVDDAGTQLAARAAAVLGLRSSPEEAVVSASNKLVFREILAAAGLPGPAFRAVPIDASLKAVAGEMAYPCVLKPLFLNASRGVIRADTPAAFEAAFARIARILATPDVAARGGTLAETVLVESYLPGAEAALEGTVVAGELRVLALLDKPEPLEGPYFQETMFVTPSRHDAALQAEMTRQGQAAVAALGLWDGPVHAEFRIDGDQVTLLEMAPRSIGGNCARVLRFGTGESLEAVILRQALGIPMGAMAREAPAAGVMMIPIPRRGVLRGVAGIGAARRVPGIEGVEISLKRGQEAIPPPEGHQYLGFIYARAESPLAVEQALRAAHAALHIALD